MSFVKAGGLVVAAVVCSLPLAADTVSYTCVNGEQQYLINTSGSYEIVAYGAAGGNGAGGFNTPTPGGGLGAQIGGDFNLTAGNVLDLYIGQQGSNASGIIWGGGGGGGTFVVLDSTGTPLIVAGGGGGGGAQGEAVVNGGTDTTGGSGLGGSAGESASGGGGFLGSGVSGESGGGLGFPLLTGGSAAGNGGSGGFGGGGGGADGGGGGGGYTGGDGGNGNSSCYACSGQGGSSYLEPGIAATVDLAANASSGEVEIIYLASPVPEPASVGLLALGLAALSFARKFHLR